MTQRGVLNCINLPHPGFADSWNKIFMADGVKDRLLALALLEFTVRGCVSPVSVPLHGIIMLAGPAGTGKTSLAHGLANRVAESLKGPALRFLEVEPHALVSSGLGRSQQAVRDLLQKTIAEHAAGGPLVVLLDEVETLAPDRKRLSLEANPVDVHRATDAVLAGVDLLAAAYPQLLFIATSNFSEAVDGAFMSRADLVEFIGKPDRTAREAILRDTLEGLGARWPNVVELAKQATFSKAVEACEGLDAREIRKAVIAACALSKDVALNPNKLSIDDVLRSIGIKNNEEKQ